MDKEKIYIYWDYSAIQNKIFLFATWMDLEDIRVSEISLKDKYGMITYMWNKKKKHSSYIENRLTAKGQWKGKMGEENVYYIWELLRQ